VLDPSGDFAYKRSIRINRQNTNFYEVTEGLEPGEKVIVSSYDSFGDKDKIIFK
jgi:HlyD family secretion protein